MCIPPGKILGTPLPNRQRNFLKMVFVGVLKIRRKLQYSDPHQNAKDLQHLILIFSHACSVAASVPGSSAFLPQDPDPGWKKYGSGFFLTLNRGSGWENSDPDGKIRIRIQIWDKHPEPATLLEAGGVCSITILYYIQVSPLKQRNVQLLSVFLAGT
jgi:hypothetical protein